MGVIFSAPVNSFKRLTGRYVLTSRLLGHTDAITCVSLSKDGNVLASGGKSAYIFLFRELIGYARIRRPETMGHEAQQRNLCAPSVHVQ